MKKRIIVVPKDKKALADLDFDKATEYQLIQILLTDLEFRSLCDYQFFSKINNIANTNVDDYEDENIIDIEMINKIIKSDVFNFDFYDAETLPLIRSIKELFSHSIELKTGVFFYF